MVDGARQVRARVAADVLADDGLQVRRVPPAHRVAGQEQRHDAPAHRGGQVRRAGVVGDDDGRVAQQDRVRPERGAAGQVDDGSAAGGDHRPGGRRLARHAADRHGQSRVGQPVGDLGEALHRPAPAGGGRARVQDGVRTGCQPRCARRLLVFRGERPLEPARCTGRQSQVLEQHQVAVDLVPGRGIGQVQGRVQPGRPRRGEAADPPGTRGRRDRVRRRVVAVGLHREVPAPLDHRRGPLRQGPVGGPLGDAGRAREGHQLVHPRGHPGHHSGHLGPGRQGDVQVRPGGAQGPHGRHGAQQVSETDAQPDEQDAAHRGVEQRREGHRPVLVARRLHRRSLPPAVRM
ncbi:MAG: hypothetical protein AVDCRST_MAG16-2884 [uncultured Frankineae bacterium]|uniref:Uncharacterized protein n=1 Tax=uncultured Frankineae bacterium TaxID=437475 RepID=A0A6J4MJ50_9ACTN|nr:MAG: hypothetical protein AVDCRST_MAG16-2884 [uncultured Frankineae bacterium]